MVSKTITGTSDPIKSRKHKRRPKGEDVISSSFDGPRGGEVG